MKDTNTCKRKTRNDTIVVMWHLKDSFFVPFMRPFEYTYHIIQYSALYCASFIKHLYTYM